MNDSEIVEEINKKVYNFNYNNPNYKLQSDLEKRYNLEGQRFGKLTALHPFRRTDIKDLSYYWLCKCDCGNYIMRQSKRLRKSKSCGCEKFEDLLNTKVNHLQSIGVTSFVGNKEINLRIIAKCDCGNVITVNPSRFKNIKTCSKKCSCFKQKESIILRLKEYQKSQVVNGVRINNVGRVKPNKNNNQKYLGVYYNKNTGKYFSCIYFQGKNHYLGSYKNKDDAYLVRLEFQKKLNEEFLKSTNSSIDLTKLVSEYRRIQELKEEINARIR